MSRTYAETMGLYSLCNKRFSAVWRVFRILLSQAWRTRIAEFSSFLEVAFSERHAAAIAVGFLRCSDATILGLLGLTVATSAIPFQIPHEFVWPLPYVDIFMSCIINFEAIFMLFKMKKQHRDFIQYGDYSKMLGVLLSLAMHWKTCVTTAVTGFVVVKLSRYGLVLSLGIILGAASLILVLAYHRLAAIIAAGAVISCGVALLGLLLNVVPGAPDIISARFLPYTALLAIGVFSLISCTLVARYMRRYRRGAMRERPLRIKLVCITAGILLTAWFPVVAVKDFPDAAEYQVPVIIIGYFLYCMMTRILLLKYTSPEALGYLIFYFKARQFSARKIWRHYNVNFLVLNFPVGVGLVAACFFTPLGYSAAALLLSCVIVEVFLNSAIVMRFFRLHRKADLPRLRQTSKAAIAAVVLFALTSPLLTVTTPVANILVGEQSLRLEPEAVWAVAACLAMVGLAVAAINGLNGKNWLENLWEPVEAEHV